MALGTPRGALFLRRPVFIPSVPDVASTGEEGRARLTAFLDDETAMVRANAAVLLAEIWDDDAALEAAIGADRMSSELGQAAAEMPRDGRVAGRLGPLILQRLSTVSAAADRLPAEFWPAHSWRLPDNGAVYLALAGRLHRPQRLLRRAPDNRFSDQVLGLAAIVNPDDPRVQRTVVARLRSRARWTQPVTHTELRAAEALVLESRSPRVAERVGKALARCRFVDLERDGSERSAAITIWAASEWGRRELRRRGLSVPQPSARAADLANALIETGVVAAGALQPDDLTENGDDEWLLASLLQQAGLILSIAAETDQEPPDYELVLVEVAQWSGGALTLDGEVTLDSDGSDWTLHWTGDGRAEALNVDDYGDYLDCDALSGLLDHRSAPDGRELIPLSEEHGLSYLLAHPANWRMFRERTGIGEF